MIKIITLYNSIILPNSTLYLRNDSINGMDYKHSKIKDEVLLILSKDRLINDFNTESFYEMGVVGTIVDKKNGITVIETRNRVSIDLINPLEEEGKFEIKFTENLEINDTSEEEERERLATVKSSLIDFVNKFEWGLFARSYIMQFNSLNEMICSLNDLINLNKDEKYDLLKENSLKKRNEEIERIIYEYINMEQINKETNSKVKEDNEKIYREHAIKKQLEYLQSELDNLHPENISDISKFEKKIKDSKMNEYAKKEAEKVINRMKQEGSSSQEYGMLYDYIDFMTSLSWDKEKYNEIDINKAKEILDQNHYGLKKVKKRIIEEIAVMNLNKRWSGNILLFVGPPGTGKTSIADAISKSMNRKYVRVSLGGIRDEAEIRGHRRTYVGALPGRILDGISKSGVSNPLMVLDEVDKLITSYDGDPASALLEVLDPEQNSTFTDHYLNVPYDLSDVFFICTANSIDKIPEALLNRMEVIEFNGYSPLEKKSIAKYHLIPQVFKKNGLSKKELSITDSAISKIISSYTMESGVRNLKRLLEHLSREAAVRIVSGETDKIVVTSNNVKDYIEDKEIRHNTAIKNNKSGIVTGLAWTSAGGEILFIESVFTKGSGNVIITGRLGDVMKESVQIAISLVKEMYPDKVKLFKDNDLHIHVPEGATPKDGPSAGITITTALASLVTKKKVSEKIAMTGEVSLRGYVMPIGGLPEKLMAAGRAGIKKVFIPEENVVDLKDVPDEVKEKLEIISVKEVKEVLSKLNLI